MIEVSHNPCMMDFIYVAERVPLDEKHQIEAFTGKPYTVDGAAIGGFITPGPKWCGYKDGWPIACGGMVPERPGVWRDFMLNVEGVYTEENYASITRHCRRIMNHMFKSGQAHRIECIVPEDRVLARPELERWYTAVGYTREARMVGYLANGTPAIMYSRVVLNGNG